MEILNTLVSILVGWGIAHLYYKKNLKDQQEILSKEVARLLKIIEESKMLSKEDLRLEHMKQAELAYKRSGNPVSIIDTFNVSILEKAEIFDTVMMRVKGRKPKVNKYRDGAE